jgi:hypothetical protein
MRTRIASLFMVTLAAVGLAGVVISATQTGLSVSYPNYPRTGAPLLSCDPRSESTANTITITGIPEGSRVDIQFTWASPYGGSPTFAPLVTHNNVTGGTLVVPVSYPNEATDWPYSAPPNIHEIMVNALIMVSPPGGTTSKTTTKGWWIRCLPPPPSAEGCTPGYWRQEHHFDSWVPTGYAPGDNFETIFGVNASFDPHTLLDAVWLGGGGENALARHAVAALLNAAHPAVDYIYTEAQIIAGVQNAYTTGNFETFKDLLDAANNAGCELN